MKKHWKAFDKALTPQTNESNEETGDTIGEMCVDRFMSWMDSHQTYMDGFAPEDWSKDLAGIINQEYAKRLTSKGVESSCDSIPMDHVIKTKFL